MDCRANNIFGSCDTFIYRRRDYAGFHLRTRNFVALQDDAAAARASGGSFSGVSFNYGRINNFSGGCCGLSDRIVGSSVTPRTCCAGCPCFCGGGNGLAPQCAAMALTLCGVSCAVAPEIPAEDADELDARDGTGVAECVADARGPPSPFNSAKTFSSGARRAAFTIRSRPISRWSRGSGLRRRSSSVSQQDLKIAREILFAE